MRKLATVLASVVGTTAAATPVKKAAAVACHADLGVALALPALCTSSLLGSRRWV